MSIPMIKLDHMSHAYQDEEGKTVYAVKDISLTIEPGEFVAVIGTNGSGKSTLAKHFNVLLTPTDGACEVCGLRTDDPDNVWDIRQEVGMVFQKPNPFPMSIYDNIAYGPRCQGLKDKKQLDEIVVRSLKQAALYEEVEGHLDGSAMGLSGGQQQRLCIARCIAMSPEVILMDEPTSALDPISTSKIEDLVLELKKNYTIVIVTHNMQQAARISDVTAFFLLGEVIECDKTDVIFSHPNDVRTENYVTGRFG